MIKATSELRPGDRIYIKGKLVTVHMIARCQGSGTHRIHHTHGAGWFSSYAEWLVEEPLDEVIGMVEDLTGGVT